MPTIRKRYDESFKKNAVKLSYARSKSVAQVARELGLSDSMLHRWRQRYTSEGEKTREAILEEENKVLRSKNAKQAIEIDMFKKGKHLLYKPPQVIYAFIQAHPEHPVVRWAKFFEVSTSGYYAWLAR